MSKYIQYYKSCENKIASKLIYIIYQYKCEDNILNMHTQ